LQKFEESNVNGEVWSDIEIKQSVEDINMKGVTDLKFINNEEQASLS